MPQKHIILKATQWNYAKGARPARVVLVKWFMCDGKTLKEYSIHMQAKPPGKEPYLYGGWYTRESLKKARELFADRVAKKGWGRGT